MKLLPTLLRRLSRRDPVQGFDERLYTGPAPDDLATRSEIEQMFWDADGPIVHKWLHYLPIYDRYFGPYRGKPVRMLEIGVSKGGSLEMWRKWFGPDLILFGIDIDPDCAQFDGDFGQVRIGSQDDPDFLRAVVAEMGGVDIVLDDGSHRSPHMRATLDVLFPMLSDGGIYMVEDLHADYWRRFEGGYGRSDTFMAQVKQLIDDMHHWYHGHGQKVTAAQDHLAALHVHDSIVVLEKHRVEPPRHAMRGAPD